MEHTGLAREKPVGKHGKDFWAEQRQEIRQDGTNQQKGIGLSNYHEREIEIDTGRQGDRDSPNPPPPPAPKKKKQKMKKILERNRVNNQHCAVFNK